MFDVGTLELVLVLVIALVVLGPERLPGLARTLGAWTRKARRMVRGLRDEVDRELATEDWKKEIERQKAHLRDLEHRLRDERGDESDDGHDSR